MAKILFVSTSTTIGGAEKTVFTLATLLDPARFPVSGVVSLKPLGAYGQKLAQAGIKTQSLGLTGLPGLRHARRLARIIDAEKPDVVHAVMYQAIQLCRLAKRRARHRFKLVSSPRVSYRTRGAVSLWIDRWLRDADDLLVCESEASQKLLLGQLGYHPGKVRVIHNGVDIASWPSSKADRERTRAELRLAADELLVGAVGRLDVQKGQSVLLDALGRLRGKARLRCALIGDGPRRAALQGQARLLKLADSVSFLGERADLTAWLSGFDIFVLPSLWEGLPNALLEAMAMGLPVLASGVDGVPEAVLDGLSGLLVRPGDAAALARRLGELAADGVLRARLGQAARHTISERFTLMRMLEAYQQAYQDVMVAR